MVAQNSSQQHECSTSCGDMLEIFYVLWDGSVKQIREEMGLARVKEWLKNSILKVQETDIPRIKQLRKNELNEVNALLLQSYLESPYCQCHMTMFSINAILWVFFFFGSQFSDFLN